MAFRPIACIGAGATSPRLDPKLRRQHDLVTMTRGKAPKFLLGGTETVHARDIEVADPTFESSVEQACRSALAGSRRRRAHPNPRTVVSTPWGGRVTRCIPVAGYTPESACPCPLMVGSEEEGVQRLRLHDGFSGVEN